MYSAFSLSSYQLPISPSNCGAREDSWEFLGQERNRTNLRGNQPWILTGMTNTEAPIFWSSDVNSQLIGKDPDAGKDWGQKKMASEDEMAGCYHWCNGHELGQMPGDGEGQGGLACCSPWRWPGDWTTVHHVSLSSPWLGLYIGILSILMSFYFCF